jgi:hypothetical protein
VKQAPVMCVCVCVCVYQIYVYVNIFIIGAWRSVCFLSEAEDPEAGEGPRPLFSKVLYAVSSIR